MHCSISPPGWQTNINNQSILIINNSAYICTCSSTCLCIQNYYLSKNKLYPCMSTKTMAHRYFTTIFRNKAYRKHWHSLKQVQSTKIFGLIETWFLRHHVELEAIRKGGGELKSWGIWLPFFCCVKNCDDKIIRKK